MKLIKFMKSKKVKKRKKKFVTCISKKEQAKLKSLYKKGKLKFNSKKLAGAILKDFVF